MAALLTKITRHPQAFIPVVFNGFDLIQAHRDVLTEALINLGFAGGGTRRLRLLQNILCNLFELIDGIRKAIGVHGYFLTACERIVKSGYDSNFDRPGRCPSPLRERYG